MSNIAQTILRPLPAPHLLDYFSSHHMCSSSTWPVSIAPRRRLCVPVTHSTRQKLCQCCIYAISRAVCLTAFLLWWSANAARCVVPHYMFSTHAHTHLRLCSSSPAAVLRLRVPGYRIVRRTVISYRRTMHWTVRGRPLGDFARVPHATARCTASALPFAKAISQHHTLLVLCVQP